MTASQAQRLADAAEDVRRVVSVQPTVALVLGSGLGGYAEDFDRRTAIPYESIRGMPRSTVEGHAGNLVFGEVGRVPVVAMQGRVHLYEGHPPSDVVFGLRLMIHLGAGVVVVTNAAGGIDPAFAAGDLMLITDHLNLTGRNCLVGPHEPDLGPRFVDMTTPYDARLGDAARSAARALGTPLREGVYAGLLGPSYETPAEIRMLRALGAQAVGMSTVLEVIAARHMGARVVGLSCITNLASGLATGPLSHEEVKQTAARARERFQGLLEALIGRVR
ncbi:MAG: purine-nucleoside phosphorylase [Myxococcota bacterium]